MQFIEANGAKIPAIGLGTWELRGRACARLVEDDHTQLGRHSGSLPLRQERCGGQRHASLHAHSPQALLSIAHRLVQELDMSHGSFTPY